MDIQTGKHAPIAPCGTTILERDNPGLSRTPFRKGKAEPEKLKLTLIDTKGNIHKRFFADKDTMDWDDPVMVGNANKWRNQVMRRVFKRDHTFKSRTIRAKWGVRETGTLKSEVENKVKAVGGRRLTGAEWKVLADEHNARFAGTKVLKGERLLGGQVAKVEEVIDKRTIVAIKALFGRNADLKQFLSDLVGENVVESGDEAGIGGGVDAKGVDEGADDEDETEEDEASPTKKRKVDHGGVIDPRLEDPSDDEDDGQRPASNPVGGALVSAF